MTYQITVKNGFSDKNNSIIYFNLDLEFVKPFWMFGLLFHLRLIFRILDTDNKKQRNKTKDILSDLLMKPYSSKNLSYN